MSNLCDAVALLSVSVPGTPEPDFDIQEEFFRPAEEEIIDLIPQLPPSSSAVAVRPASNHPVEAPIQLPQSSRQRLPHRQGESLQERVLRTACDISTRRESKKAYAARRTADKYKCKLCGVFLNSIATRTAHFNGSKHKSKEKRVLEGPLLQRHRQEQE